MMMKVMRMTQLMVERKKGVKEGKEEEEKEGKEQKVEGTTFISRIHDSYPGHRVTVQYLLDVGITQR